jgi:hypothetical protein
MSFCTGGGAPGADGEQSPGGVRRHGAGGAHLVLLPRGAAAVSRACRPHGVHPGLPAQSHAGPRLLPRLPTARYLPHDARGCHLHAGVSDLISYDY